MSCPISVSRPLIVAVALSLALVGVDSAHGQETMRLSGGITHSDKMEPLPAEDRVGATVNPAAEAAADQAATRQAALAAQKIQAEQLAKKQAREQLKAQAQARASAEKQARERQAAIQLQARREQQASLQQLQARQAAAQKQSQAALQAIAVQQAAALRQSATPGLSTFHPTGPGQQTGSPMAPRLQAMAPKLDSRAQYQKNLQALASLDLNRTGGALQAGLQANAGAAKIEVPFWLAGEWARAEENETSRVELPSGKALKAVGRQKAAVHDTFGTYRDKSGKVWMVVPLRNRGAIDRGFAIDRHQVVSYQLILTGKTSALIKVQAIHTVVDKATSKIIQAYQDEELNSYSLVWDGLVNTDSSVKVFDQSGAPKLQTRASSIERRIHKL